MLLKSSAVLTHGDNLDYVLSFKIKALVEKTHNQLTICKLLNTLFFK